MTQQPGQTPQFDGKINVLPTAVRAGLIVAGVSAVMNLAHKTSLGTTAIDGYQKAVHGFLKMLGGSKLTDKSLLNAGSSSLVDFIGMSVCCLVIGRLGLEAPFQRLGQNLKNLWNHNRGGPQPA